MSLPVVATQISHDPAPGAPAWLTDDDLLARSLYTVWAIRTGRTLRAVPITELNPGELIEFWADDQLELLSRHPGVEGSS